MQSISVGSALEQAVPVRTGAVAFAGSRNGRLPAHTATALVEEFLRLGFGLLAGCAPGIDRCFRTAFHTVPDAAGRAIVACAFDSRARRLAVGEVFTGVVVPDGLSAAAALHRRTVWVVAHCALLLLFPDDPHTGRWGRGSRLAFEVARAHLKPVFLSTARPPEPSPVESIRPARLFGVVDGYWVVPEGGPDDKE